MEFSRCCALIKANKKHIFVKVKSGVEISQENGSKAVLIVFVRDARDADEAVVHGRQAVQVALGLDCNLGILEHKLKVAVDVLEVGAALSGDKNGLAIDNLRGQS